MPSDVPAAPEVGAEEIWQGAPNVLVDEGNYTIGWQADEGGPCFVTVKRGPRGELTVLDRFPLSGEGWARAWENFSGRDPAAAERVTRVLDERARDGDGSRTLVLLKYAMLAGGHRPGTRLHIGESYDLRFLSDRLAVFRPGAARPLEETAYPDIRAVEITSGLGDPSLDGDATIATIGVGGELVTLTSARLDTSLRVETSGGELFFVKTGVSPEDMRIRLSEPLAAIRAVQPSTVADEVLRLARLLDDGLLTREEFVHLKSGLLRA
jgi:hypothetical protein